ncbi:hypothetical protein BYT27DRAFT_6936227 [Phlegmacium glaucopus]|nr:hypothetical protein BYT27DRAFT_6936227 [Phlegmacium glaucopus]
MGRPPLPNVLVTFDTICVVDVTGITDFELLRQALFGTLWEHDYLRGRLDIVISSDPDLSLHHHASLSRDRSLSSEELFSLCENCGGSLKLFARQPAVPNVGKMYIRSPQWYQAPDVVVNVFTHYEKKFLCDVELAGAETVGMIMDRIVKELQYRHYYLPKGGTRPTSEHQSTTCQSYGPAAAFYGHFREDIGPDGSLKLFVDAYQARAAKRIIKQQPGTNDLNITEYILWSITMNVDSQDLSFLDKCYLGLLSRLLRVKTWYAL